MSSLYKQYGPTALVTGATSGIGNAFAFQLAAMGFDLIIVSRNEENLEQVSREIKAKHSVNIYFRAIDLSDASQVETMLDSVQDFNIGLVINNAGWGIPGVFQKHLISDSLKELQLNVTTPLSIARHFIDRVTDKRERAGLIFLSSIAGYTGSPYLAGYAAAKAWVLNFGMALGIELKPKGIDVLVVAPGPTKTGMFGIDNLDFEKLPMHWMRPEEVAKEGLRALGKKTIVIPGRINRVMNFISSRIMSKPFAMFMFGKMMRRSMPESIV
ncbi:MAG: SDR family NAD(P)-dependent oxidoreductase [Kangiellaceae bacterium]|nr:SDR family NAD(P)-dependent oxidoreductase [Kangiellaceae bacterium]